MAIPLAPMQATAPSQHEAAAAPAGAYSSPRPGASLMLAFRPPQPPSTIYSSSSSDFTAPAARSTVLLIGSNHLAAIRLFSLLEAGYKVVVAHTGESTSNSAKVNGTASSSEASLKATLTDPGLLHLIRTHSTSVSEARILPDLTSGDPEEAWKIWLGSLPQFDELIFAILTETFLSPRGPDPSSNTVIGLRRAAHRLRLPLNISDAPHLSDFSFPVTHRFASVPPSTSPSSSSTPVPSPLQIALTTNAASCRLGARLKRDIVARCERSAGAAVAAVGKLRTELREQASRRASSVEQDTFAVEGEADEDVEGLDLKGGLNRPVEQMINGGRHRRTCSRGRATNGCRSQSRGRTSQRDKDLEVRMRWIAQISEYWPIDEIARLEWDEEERKRLLRIFDDEVVKEQPAPATPIEEEPPVVADGAVPALPTLTTSRHHLDLTGPPPPLPLQRGRILLIGSGPGSPHLLTLAAYRALTSSATLILSDKLVPPPILALIPKHIPLQIAKKFPGNADNAQNEFMTMAVDAARKGHVVVRLKQGDPYLYGRGGEEVVHFRERGFDPIVVPGVSSSLAGPLLGGMPVTMRGIADSLTICTGVGKAGRVMAGADWPKYNPKRTLSVLMGVARLGEMIKGLTSPEAGYPPYLPIAIVEKASVSDGRVVRSSLENIEHAYERLGGKRVPGMIMIGWACFALEAATAAERDGVEVQLPPMLSDAESSAAARTQREKELVTSWLGPAGVRVTEGGGTEGWDEVFGSVAVAAAVQAEIAIGNGVVPVPTAV